MEINPIIARDVMLDRFREYSGGVYANPRVSIEVDDGRNFVRRSTSKYDVIQASLVDTWAATAAGAYTLTENSLYTKEAFGEYVDHLTDGGLLTITRWVFDGLRLVSLAQDACASEVSTRQPLAIIRYDRVATFLLKKEPFTAAEVARLHDASTLGFSILYAPGFHHPRRQRAGRDAAYGDERSGLPPSDPGEQSPAVPHIVPAGRIVHDRRPPVLLSYDAAARSDAGGVRPQHVVRQRLSALMTLMAISAMLVILFVIGPLLVGGGRPGRGWAAWLAYFGALGAGFMLLEVALLQRFVLLLGHPVYSLTVTLFSLLLGTGIGSLISRRIEPARVRDITVMAIVGVALVASAAALGLAPLIDIGIPWALPTRIAFAVALIAPVGILLGMPLPGGMRLVAADRADIIPWGWGINGAFSVVGATLAVFIAMNWGFSVTLFSAAAVYRLR